MTVTHVYMETATLHMMEKGTTVGAPLEQVGRGDTAACVAQSGPEVTVTHVHHTVEGIAANTAMQGGLEAIVK